MLKEVFDMEIRGPKAPKDPTKKRKNFYIMRNKDIAASPKKEGGGVCFIYENDGRMISASGLVGGITDEEELNLLKTTEGFRKLVHSIGVTVESNEHAEDVTFVFQMYGKRDVYGSGTNIISPIPTNGMEIVIDLNDIDWSDDDNEPGQIRFEFARSGVKATVSVRFYLNDGYDAPEVEDEHPVDIHSDEYKAMIEKSLMNMGNNHRIKKALDKARNGEKTTLAFIGGSITQGAGAVPINTECYARKIYEGFCDMTGCKYDTNVSYIKAGVGGTPSELGMLRYDKDILKEGSPDVVVVEFAVNDEGDETKGECFDSLVRKIYEGSSHPAVLILFSVFADDYNLQDRLKCVGEAYDLPMVSIKNAVTDQFYLKFGSGRVVSKNQYFYDRYHPSNLGHRIMADGVLNMFALADKGTYDEEIVSLKDIKAPIGSDFENVIRIDRDENPTDLKLACGSYSGCDIDIQAVERNMDLFTTPQFKNNWMYEGKLSKGEIEPFTVEGTFKILLMVFKDSAENRTGRADVYVDGVKTFHADPREVGWTHCNAAIVYRSSESGFHKAEVRIEDGCEDKEFTILGFGAVL